MNVNKYLICIACNSSKLNEEEEYLECMKCKSYFPKYKGVPVMLTDENDFYHLRKALLPAKYRINIYED